MALIVTAATIGSARRRQHARLLAQTVPAVPTGARDRAHERRVSRGNAGGPVFVDPADRTRFSASIDESSVREARAAESPELGFRWADRGGDAQGAFNLGVVLHGRGDSAGAAAAYERAERRGDPDAAFNLGVLMYEVGDLDAAEAAWRRSVERGHLQADANLRFLLRRRAAVEVKSVARAVAEPEIGAKGVPR